MSLISETEERAPAGAGLWPQFSAWLDGALAAQRESLVLWMPVLFGCGIGAYFSLRAEPDFVTGAVIAVTAASLFTFMTGLRRRDERFYPLWLVSAAIFLITAGFTDAQFRTLSLHTIMLHKEIRAAYVTGHVVAIDELEPDKGLRVVLDQLQIEGLPPAQMPQKIRLTVRKPGEQKVGDRIGVKARIGPPGPPEAPGAFDFQRYAYFSGIGGSGFAFGAPEVLERGQASGLEERLEDLRRVIASRIEKQIPYPDGPVATSFIVEERTGISSADWDAMRFAGLAHMLSISGMNISVVAGIVFFTLRFLMALIPPLALHYPIKKYAAVCAFIAILVYTLLAGASVPVVRSFIMTAIVLLAVVLDRLAITPRLVAIAALIVLTLWPESLTGASFQMSFSAVVALVITYDRLRGKFTAWYGQAGILERIGFYLAGIGATTLIATIATAPFSLYHFQSLALYGVIANLIGGPLMTFVIMPAAVLACTLMPFRLEQAPLWVMGKAVAALRAVAYWVAGLPHAAWLAPAWPVSALVLFAFAGCIAMFWRGRGALAAIVPVLLAGAVMINDRPPDILLSSDAKLAGVRDAEGDYILSSRVHAKRAASDWLQRNGQDPEKSERFPSEGVAMNGELTCGEGGCHLIRGGRKVAFSFAPETVNEDCAWADILIANSPVRGRCRAGLVIDRFDVWRNGAYAVWMDGHYETVAGNRGDRPWTVTNRR